MIGTWLILGFFVVAGLAVVGLAMTGSRKPEGERNRRSRADMRLVATGVGAVVVAIGIGVPAWVLVANAQDAPLDGPGGVELTAADATGRELFVERCASCHTLEAANAVGRVGPDLDQMRPPKALIIDAIENGRARGLGQMPAGLFDGEEAEKVAEFIVKVAGR